MIYNPISTRSKYLGVASPADDATAYMGIVEQVFAHYKRHLSHVPLVINTMGWNKGKAIKSVLNY